jgi:hypothetical protein
VILRGRAQGKTETNSIDLASKDWWAAIVRDGHACRVAPFLPDLACVGSLSVYNPADLADTDPAVDEAITVCDGHLRWLAEHRAEATGLGLIH